MNCTPFVRQYDILTNKWGALLCQKEYQTNVIHQNSRSRWLRRSCKTALAMRKLPSYTKFMDTDVFKAGSGFIWKKVRKVLL